LFLRLKFRLIFFQRLREDGVQVEGALQRFGDPAEVQAARRTGSGSERR
jgi:hypothetical protein